MKRLVLILALAVTTACATLPSAPPVVVVPGHAALGVVVSNGSSRVADATVSLHTGESNSTDQDGYVVFQNLPLGGRGVTIKAAGYFDEFVSVDTFAGNTQIDILLKLIPVAPPTPPEFIHPNPLIGQLTTRGDACYADDTGCRIVSVYHAGDMFALFAAGHIDEVRSDLKEVASAGYQVVRSWVSLNDGGDPRNVWAGPRYLGVGPRITPDYKGKLVAFANLLAEYKLKWHMAAGGIDAMTTAVEEQMFRDWRDAMSVAGPDKWALVEACNECRDTSDRNGDNEPAHLERLINIVRQAHPQVLYTLTAYTGTEDPAELKPYQPSWVKFTYYHGYRGGVIADKIRHRVSMALESGLGRLFWDGEPAGPWSRWGLSNDRLTQVSAQSNDHEFDEESVAAMALGSVIGHGAHAFMSSTGVRRYISPSTFPGFKSVPMIFGKVPQDAQTGRLVHAGRSNSPIEPTTNSNGDLGRADSLLLTDGRVVSLVYGQRPGTYHYRLRQGLNGKIINIATGEESVVDLRAGQTLTLTLKWAVLIVARIQ